MMRACTSVISQYNLKQKKMIKSKINLAISTARISTEAIVVINPRFDKIETDFNTGKYLVPVQDFYLVGDIQHPIEERKMELEIIEVMAKTGGLKSKIIEKVLEITNLEPPYGSKSGDWEKME